MELSILLALVGAVAALAAALLLVVHYGAGARPLIPLVEACSAELKEIERKSRDKLLTEADADSARSMALRRLLQAHRASESRWWLLRGDRSALMIVGLAAVSVVALGTLGGIDADGGRPAPSISVREDSADPDVARLASYVRAFQPRGPLASTINSSAEKGLPDVETMIKRLTARLKSAPDDADGWHMLGWSLLHTQQPDRAAEAYERAVALRPKSADFMVAYGEALVAAKAGTVTPKATDTFSAALQIDAANTKARYFLALAKEQSGKEREALDEWLSVLGELVEDEPWTADLRERTTALARKLGMDVTARIGSTAPSADNAKTPKGEGLKQPISTDQQQALVRGMVDGFASRLEASPRDEEGWIKLMRSRVVLGEEPVALDTLKRALAVFADDRAAQSRIRAAARELGLTSK